MTKPGDPEKGKAAEQEQAEQAAKDSAQEASVQAADEKAEAKPKARKPRAKKEPAPSQAEGTAAEETGVDKAGAEAAAVTEPGSEAAKPKRAKKPKPAAKKDDTRKASPSGAGKPAGKAAAAPAKPAAAPARRRRKGQTADRVIVRAQAKYVRSSPRKARLVCDHIRGKTVPEARAILAFSPRSVSEAWSKLLESAVANAENNHDLVGDELKIHAVFADAGPTIKRFRPRAMGRATRIRKRTSHLTIQLTPREG